MKKLRSVAILVLLWACSPDPVEQIQKHKEHLENLSQYMMSFPSFRPYLGEAFKNYENEWKRIVTDPGMDVRERANQMEQCNQKMMQVKIYKGLHTFSKKHMYIKKKLKQLKTQSVKKPIQKKIQLVEKYWQDSQNLLLVTSVENYTQAIETITRANQLLRLANQNVNLIERAIHKKKQEKTIGN